MAVKARMLSVERLLRWKVRVAQAMLFARFGRGDEAEAMYFQAIDAATDPTGKIVSINSSLGAISSMVRLRVYPCLCLIV